MRNFKTVKKVVLSIASFVLSIFLVSLVVDLDKLLDIGQNSTTTIELICVFSILLFSWFLAGRRLSIFFSLANQNCFNSYKCFLANWGGAFFAFGVPLGPLADPVRIFMLHKKQISLQITVKIMILDKICQLIISVGLIAAFSSVQYFLGVQARVLIVQLLFVLAFLLSLGIAGLVFFVIRERILLRFGYALGTMQVIRSNFTVKNVFEIVVLSCVTIFCHWAVFLVLLPGDLYSLTKSLELLSITPATYLIQHMPFLFSGWGGRELYLAEMNFSSDAPEDSLLLNLSIEFGIAYMLVSLTGVIALVIGLASKGVKKHQASS